MDLDLSSLFYNTWTESETFEKDFKPVMIEHQDDLLYVRRDVVKNIVFFFIKFKTTESYSIIENNSIVSVPPIVISKAKENSKNAEDIFNAAKKANPDKLQTNLMHNTFNQIRIVLWAFLPLMMLFTLAAYLYVTQDKNFDSETKNLDISTYQNIEVGDFVTTDLPILNSYSIEEFMENVSTGERSDFNEGNSYFLSFFFIEGEANANTPITTFVFRTSPDSQVLRDVENQATTEDLIVVEVEGEIKELSAIETLDEGEQILDFFNSSITEDFTESNLLEPVIFVDGVVTKGDLRQAYLIVGGMTSLTLLSFLLIFYSKRRYNKYLNNFIESI